jgi:hypothetical protein
MGLMDRSAPLGYVDGRPIWSYFGAEGEGDGNTSGTQSGSGSTDGAQSGGTSEGGTSEGEGSAQSGGQSSSDGGTVTREEFERIQRQLSEADKKREAAEKRAKEYEDKDKGELEKATERAETAEARVKELEGEMARFRLEKSMLTDKDHGADKWHDVDYVLSALQGAVKDGSVTIEEDGTVKGVSGFLKSLASNKKYLLKAPASGSGASGDSNNRDRRGGSTGSGEGSTDEAAKKRRKELQEQYPSLRR